jgi:vacuolar-type H+-ATPase subunit F/Vma7
MVQQGQIIELTRRGSDGKRLWAYRYRTGGRDSKRVQRGGFVSAGDAREALERHALQTLPTDRGLSLVARHVFRAALAGITGITVIVDSPDTLVVAYLEAIRADVADDCDLRFMTVAGTTATKLREYHRLNPDDEPLAAVLAVPPTDRRDLMHLTSW